jgi:hydroxyethylthiazole kinase-like sugar kinase family protein
VKTFVVRIYNKDTDAGELNGSVDEVASGRRTTFGHPEQLLRILVGTGDVSSAAEPEEEDEDS